MQGSGNFQFQNAAGNTITTTTGGNTNEQTITLGGNGPSLKVDGGNNNIVLSQDGETVTFDGTNGLVSTEAVKGSTIHGTSTTSLSIRGYGKSIFGDNGTGTVSTSHQFQGLGSDTNAFLVNGSDGDPAFKIEDAGASIKISMGDVGLGNEGNILVLDEGEQLAYFTNLNNEIKVGVNTSTPDQELHVVGNAKFGQRRYTTQAPASAGVSEGEVVVFGSGTTVAGKLYHYNGGWNLTNANPATSAATSGSLVAMALDDDPDVDGMLLRGIARPLLSGGAGGKTVYFDSVDGGLTTTVPTTSGYIVRIAGHCLDANTIYFNPSPDWIILA